MKFSLWTKYGARNSVPVFEAFRRSLVMNGYKYEYNCPDADVDVIWSVLWKGRMAPNKDIFNNGKPTIVIEVGSIHRGITWRVGFNGIGRRNVFFPQGNDQSRANALNLRLAPWRTDGEYILICCQNPNSLLWKGMPTPAEWIKDTVNKIREVSDRHIIIRQHPRAPFRCILPPSDNISYEKPVKIPGSYDDYDMSFKKIHATVNCCSGPGPESIINGVPAFVGVDSLAWHVGNHSLKNIENPYRPCRQQWLNDYAHTEFTTNEIAQGAPLHKLLKLLDK